MDDPLLQALGWLAGVMTFALCLVSALGQTRACRRHLREAARAIDGRVRGNGWGERPRLDFAVDGIPAEFVYSPGPWARVRFRWSAPGRLRIAPAGESAGARRLPGDLGYDVPEFAGGYDVEGGPEAWVLESLSDETRGCVLALAALGAPTGGSVPIRIDVGPFGLSVFYRGNPAAEHELLTGFLSLSSRLLRGLRGDSPAGAPAESAEEVAADGRCPVCGVGLDGVLRRCQRCRTFHHGDCWEYFGGCAMYGCFSRQAERVRLE
ncbi:MAG: hypothetical protein HY718_07495 [Planctomycetes bacterium]|nr:hypothetical protein [Planctomycetota bacterium]